MQGLEDGGMEGGDWREREEKKRMCRDARIHLSALRHQVRKGGMERRSEEIGGEGRGGLQSMETWKDGMRGVKGKKRGMEEGGDKEME